MFRFITSLCFVALLVTSCGQKDATAAWWQGERERIELSHRLELSEMRFQQIDSGAWPKLVELRQLNEVAAKSIIALKQQKIEATKEVENFQSQFAQFRESVLTVQRNRVRGRTFPALATASGREYQDVAIVAIDDAGVSIRHAAGSARLRYADLDSNQRLLFGLDEDLATAATQRESLEIAAYERWSDEQLVTHNAKKEKRADASLQEELLSKENRRIAAARDAAAASSRPLAQPARSFSSGYSRTYSAYRSSRPFYRHVYYTPSYCNTAYYNRSRSRSDFMQTTMRVTRHPSGCYAPPSRETSRKSITDISIPFNP